MRSLNLVASLAALVVMSSSNVFAASASSKAKASYASSNASHASQAAEPVPPNCVRQECGKLWCWNMGHGKSSSR